jgi:large subunit ribosomal protein L1
MAKLSKRQKALTAVDREKFYGVDEALSLVKGNASAKFDETVEVALNLGVDPRHADQMVRGVVNLPKGTGKTVRVAVFAKGAKADEATAAGADVVGAEDLMETIQGGQIDFDRVIATPDMMGVVGRLGRILGPRGKMPNPKAGTITFDIARAVQDSKAGKLEYRTDRGANVHLPIGKKSFEDRRLLENYASVVEEVVRAKPAAAKGRYIRSITLTSTMAPGIRVDPSRTRNVAEELEIPVGAGISTEGA